MQKTMGANVVRLMAICLVWWSCIAITEGEEIKLTECHWSIQNGKSRERSTTIEFLNNSLRVPVVDGMEEYIASVQQTLSDLNRQISESTSNWNVCLTNATPRKCRSVMQTASVLNATAVKVLQNLRRSNERLLQISGGKDSNRARCLNCVRGGLNRFFFGLLPQYWLQFGLNFGVGTTAATPTTQAANMETQPSSNGDTQATTPIAGNSEATQPTQGGTPDNAATGPTATTEATTITPAAAPQADPTEAP